MGLFCSMRQNILYLLQFFIQFPLLFLVFLLLGCMIIFEFFPMVHVVLESSIVFYLISIIYLNHLLGESHYLLYLDFLPEIRLEPKIWVFRPNWWPLSQVWHKAKQNYSIYYVINQDVLCTRHLCSAIQIWNRKFPIYTETRKFFMAGIKHVRVCSFSDSVNVCATNTCHSHIHRWCNVYTSIYLSYVYY